VSDPGKKEKEQPLTSRVGGCSPLKILNGKLFEGFCYRRKEIDLPAFIAFNNKALQALPGILIKAADNS